MNMPVRIWGCLAWSCWGLFGLAACSSCEERDAAETVSEPLTIGVQLEGRGRNLHQALHRATRKKEIETGSVKVLNVVGGDAAMLKQVSLQEPVQRETNRGEKWNPYVRQRQARLVQFLVRKELDCVLLSLDRFLRMLISSPEIGPPRLVIVGQLGAFNAGRRTRHILVRNGGMGIGSPPFKGRTVALLDHPLERFQLGQLLESVGVSADDVTLLAVKDPLHFLEQVSAGEPDLAVAGFGAVPELGKQGFWPLVEPILQPGMAEVDVLVCQRSVLQEPSKEAVLQQVVGQLDDMLSSRFRQRGGELPGGLGATALPDVQFLSQLSQQLIDAGLTTSERSLSDHLLSDASTSFSLPSTEAGEASRTKLNPDSRMEKTVPE